MFGALAVIGYQRRQRFLTGERRLQERAGSQSNMFVDDS